MRNVFRSNFLYVLFILDLLVVAVGWYTRNSWFGWDYLNSVSKLLITMLWLALAFSLPALIVIAVMKSQRLERARIYIILLYFGILLNIISLVSGVGWCLVRYESSYFITIHTNIHITYHPLLLPIIFSVDTSGNISVEGDTSIVTEIGTFSLSAEVSASQQTDDKSLFLVIRHLQNNLSVDSVYKIATQEDEVFIVTHGIVTTDVTQKKIFIDASAGDVQRIQISGPSFQTFSENSIL